MSSVAEDAGPDAVAELPREVWALIGANAVIALGYGMVAPVLPQLARHFGVSISEATFIITASAVGYGNDDHWRSTSIVGVLCDLRTASDDGGSMRRDHG